jgi:hypothetical protein
MRSLRQCVSAFVWACEAKSPYRIDSLSDAWHGKGLVKVLVFDPNAVTRSTIDIVARPVNAPNKSSLLIARQTELAHLIIRDE